MKFGEMEEMAPFYAPGRECCSSTTFSPPEMVHFRKVDGHPQKSANLAFLVKLARLEQNPPISPKLMKFS